MLLYIESNPPILSHSHVVDHISLIEDALKSLLSFSGRVNLYYAAVIFHLSLDSPHVDVMDSSIITDLSYQIF